MTYERLQKTHRRLIVSLTVVRQLTLDKDSALHASIAGGRKTMGFFLGYALSLFGREQDRLSHVLVSAPYESHPEFFYPSQSSELIYSLSNGQSFNKRDAEIALAEIPFVRMRDGLDVNLLNGGISYSDAVAVAQRILPPVCLTIDVDRRVINTGGTVYFSVSYPICVVLDACRKSPKKSSGYLPLNVLMSFQNIYSDITVK